MFFTPAAFSLSVTYVRLAKNKVNRLLFTDHIQNANRNWYLKFYIHNCIQTLSEMLE